MSSRLHSRQKQLIEQTGARKRTDDWTADGGYTLQRTNQKWIVKNEVEGFHVELYIFLDALTAVAQHQETTSKNHFKKSLQETTNTK